jgi:hypothetical protein
MKSSIKQQALEGPHQASEVTLFWILLWMTQNWEPKCPVAHEAQKTT